MSAVPDQRLMPVPAQDEVTRGSRTDINENARLCRAYHYPRVTTRDSLVFQHQPLLAREIRRQVFDVALGEVRNHRPHDRALALARPVVLQRFQEIIVVLAGKPGIVRNGAVAVGAVACRAGLGLLLALCRVAGENGRVRREHRAASGQDDLVHFGSSPYLATDLTASAA